jgi:hypothetical protein
MQVSAEAEEWDGVAEEDEVVALATVGVVVLKGLLRIHSANRLALGLNPRTSKSN